MKSIFFATDYSPASLNAGDYAAQLAKLTGSELVVFHAWSLPATSGEAIAFPASINDLEKINKEGVENEAVRLQQKWGVKVTAEQKAGFASEEIMDSSHDHSSGMIILGMRHPNKAGKIFGSVAISVMKKSKIPVLIVPEKANFRQPKIILLATDLQTNLHWHELSSLKELAGRFHAGIHILNAARDLELTERRDAASGMRLDNFMKAFPHTWHFADDEDVVHAISEKAHEIEADLIAVIHHRLPWYQEIFHHSITRELSFATERPLLVLPEHVSHIDT